MYSLSGGRNLGVCQSSAACASICARSRKFAIFSFIAVIAVVEMSRKRLVYFRCAHHGQFQDPYSRSRGWLWKTNIFFNAEFHAFSSCCFCQFCPLWPRNRSKQRGENAYIFQLKNIFVFQTQPAKPKYGSRNFQWCAGDYFPRNYCFVRSSLVMFAGERFAHF